MYIKLTSMHVHIKLFYFYLYILYTYLTYTYCTYTYLTYTYCIQRKRTANPSLNCKFYLENGTHLKMITTIIKI